ncbi:glucose-1-phosphate adenylyltransferase subunit GlgD [Oceanobacillus caeni]|uniref:glucose-1-phosphate adenylyltransferase subunit GlgD n=1 Tax=Bacillaceae TaxID=186817 RepID=UPI0006219BF9|nr:MULTISPECIES: glucose-1-phosphate adenylyltransferase subunit GlgD [Bacillaceae]KKE79897.1 glucose-1-phosphate adenylyltransferase subunit GlgD [Bacilli bacterium VT-13-104]PZD84108.1 glucose-1-phosphate adenylyltransferase subunit GlgD [Bacilli bacterium]MBU8792175.1 glucose-1-phosphate adenylyltransferase subunit GlgD [Oceanobacillus caeni]MCR1835742.1 glucose-1-phosphate adenylyltransferase subunit GlgD [Oceanobacillus caeni]MED4475515.1 glucose-1-phosphate adenylyltransferase subunit Gl
MKTMMGLINLEHEHHVFNELTYFRTHASIPFAGRYRMIDFALSNMVNSGINEVAIFARSKYRSLSDHLGTGENWNLDRRNGGLYILPPDWNDPSDVSKGDLQFFHNNRDYFNRGKSDYVLISGSQFTANIDYDEAFKYHIDRGADVTLVTTVAEELREEHIPYFRICADDLGWVEDITNEQTNPLLFTGAYIINRSLLMELVDDCIAYNRDHFFVHGIKEKLADLRVVMYRYKGYGAFINSIESYYRHNMNLLIEDNYLELFFNPPFVKTKVSSNPPAKYYNPSSVKQSILANGCEVEGEVDKSILFRGVIVNEGAQIKNSIIMQRCTIEEDVYLENVILDKDVHVKKGQRIIGSKDKPYVVAKRSDI